jgi:hypothetical protein
MTIISFADEYRKRVGVRIRTLMIDGRHMTEAEYQAIPQDDTSDDAGVVWGWVSLCRSRCTTRIKKHKHIIWQRDEDGALRVSTWRASDKRLKQWRIPQLFVISEDTDPPGAA